MLRGFFPEHVARQAEWEKIFRAVPTPEQAREDLKTLTRTPHVAGTLEDLKTAQYVLEQFRAAGLEAEIVEYQVLLPMPREVRVDLVAPVNRAGPSPDGEGDRSSADSRLLPAFNAFSPSGDVAAEVVYANYGLPEDYRRLRELGVDAAGKIVIVRYGRCFRGVKAYVAEKNHAAGLLIYSDPAEDGYRQGDVFPRGPWRPATAVQRGSILSLSEYSGDPLTPGVASTKTAPRQSLKDTVLPRVPTTPLSYADASPILEHLAGPVAPREWQGALPFAYHLGPGLSKVHLKLDMDYQVRPIWDVVAKIPGAEQTEEWVVMGNHRDAWTYGAADPASGTAPLLAVARGLGRLMKLGWKPRRTIVLGSWDAEEFGLMGSTEWAEDHADELTRYAVAYLNMDVGVCGPNFGASAVPSLSRLIREITQEVTDPKSGRRIFDVWQDESRTLRRESGLPVVTPSPDELTEPLEARVGMLGSGSDYTPFLQHLGVPSLDVGFGGPYGVYHSAYDNFDWMQKFGDPHFYYSVAAAKIFGTLALRLAAADILLFDYEDYGQAIQKYLHDLEAEIRKNKGAEQLSFEECEKAAAEFSAVARKLGQKLAKAEENGSPNPQQIARLNRSLIGVERSFLLDKGLPGRPWFRHAFYAPGVYTGYAAVIFPGVRDAVEAKDWPTARLATSLVASAIGRGTATLRQALQALDGTSGEGRR